MAHKTTIQSPTTPGDIIDTEEINGSKVPRSKVVLGAYGTDDGDVSLDNPMPSVIVLDGGELTLSNTLPASIVVGGGRVNSGNPLPASLVAAETHLGEVGGNTIQVVPSLAVSTSIYASGDIVGGKLTLPNAVRVSGGTGMIQSIMVIDQDNQKPVFDLLIFDRDPSNGTYSDNGAFTIHASDAPFLIRRISVSAGDWTTIGGIGIADLDALGRTINANSGTSLYGLIILNGSTPTYTASTKLTIKIGILRD